MSERTYLELSEDAGVSHKFYEVIVENATLTIRYGRIGTDGTKSIKEFPTPEKAKAEAAKKIKQKKNKGYEEAVMGVRKKRAITRRQTTSTQSSTKTKAPLLWKFETKRSAFGIFVDDNHCWVGNEAGKIYALDHNGTVERDFKLPDGVKAIVADGDWLYAGCDDGNVYDLTGKLPFVAYEIAEDVDIYWIDIADGVLGVSDAQGNVHVFNHEDVTQWNAKSSGTSGWMVRCDEIGVYHGHTGGVTMYDWEDGSKIWEEKTGGSVLFGWQEEDSVYAGCGDKNIYRFTKQGEKTTSYKCDSMVYSCSATENGKFVFAGDSSSNLYCFDETGKRLWKVDTRCGSALSMQYHNEKLYIVTTNGTLACMDAREEAIEGAKEGNVPTVKDVKLAAAQASVEVGTLSSLETVREAGDKVTVECYKEGSKLRVRVVSEGYNSGFHVQFPKNLREEGARFVVDEIRESARGGFYRAHGEIKRLEA